MMWCQTAAVTAVLLVSALLVVRGDETTQHYQDGERLKVYANKIGPFNNPLETYAFFEMPFVCPPETWVHKSPSLGEALAGDELYSLDVRVYFKKESSKQLLSGLDVASSGATKAKPEGLVCELTPTDEQVKSVERMVNEQYWYQLNIDGLPMWATLGKVGPVGVGIYTHQKFSFGYNDDRLVLANLTVEELTPVVAGRPIRFTYEVQWQPVAKSFDERFRRYLDDNFFEHRIHWFSIFNSFMMVLFLAGIVLAIFSRALKKDFAKLAVESDGSARGGAAADDFILDRSEWEDDSGWKQLYADVFRVPPRPSLLCALIGTGFQVICLLLFLIVIAAVKAIGYATPGSLLSVGTMAYALTSLIAGFVSSSKFGEFSALGGVSLDKQRETWTRTMLLTASLVPGGIIVWVFLLNFVAIAYDSAQAIPFVTMVVVVLLWALVDVPLVLIGTVVSRNFQKKGPTKSNIRVAQIPRIIPTRQWYLQRPVLLLAGACMPFGSIFIELYFVFTSFWNYKFYYVYGFLLLVFIILLLVTACVAVVSSYFLLNAEDHRWHWNSFGLGLATSFYVFLYALYFYVAKTKMRGFFMLSFYCSYMGMFSLAIALVCGTAGYVATAAFVNIIYANVKID